MREGLQLGFRRPSLLVKREKKRGRKEGRGREKRSREESRERRFRGVGYDDVAKPERMGSRAWRVTRIGSGVFVHYSPMFSKQDISF